MNYLDELMTAINEEIITPNRLEFLINLIKSKFPESLRKQENIYEKICEITIEKIKSNQLDDAITLLKLIYISENNQLGHTFVKSSGIFRSSKYNYEYKKLISIIEEIKEFLLEINNQNLNNYFNSVISLLKLSEDIKIEYQNIVTSLKNDKILRFALNTSDHTFLVKTTNPEFFLFSETIEENIIKSLFFSPEEISNSISTILKIYNKSQFNNEIPPANFSTLLNFEKDIIEIIKSAFLINTYSDLEIEVGVFEYNIFNQENKFIVQGGNFEKHKRIGYFLSEQRRIVTTKQAIDEFSKKIGWFSKLNDAIKELCLEGKIQAYHLKNNPDRFILTPPYELFKTSQFSVKTLALEDLTYLTNIYHENYLFSKYRLIDLPNIKIHKNFTVMDYINLSKIFKISSYSLQSAYFNNKDTIENIDEVLTNSLLSIFPKDQLFKLIKYVLSFQTDQEIEEFLSPIVLDITKEVDYIDLQYTPLLKINDREYLSLTATSFNSDLIRRICIKNKFSFSIDNTQKPIHDCMVEELEKAFKNRDFLVKTDFKFSKFELDFIAFKDNTLFIFECKNPYHPVNNHELRNTYDHIEHAFFQLNRAKFELEENGKLKQLFTNLEWTKHYNPEMKIYYGISNANRMLVGYSKNDVHVHHAHQLINLLGTGKVQNFDISESLWSGDDFHTTDLVKFITGETNNHHHDHLTEKYSFNFKTSNHEICIESYLSGVNQLRKQSNIEKNISVQLEDYI